MKFTLPKIERATKKRILLLALFAVGVLTLIAYLAVKVAFWFDNNKIIVKNPILITTQSPVTVEKRVVQIITPTVTVNYPQEIDTDIKKRICEVWGVYECKTAIAVASHEGLNHKPYEFNTNTNGTIDVGYFRINSVHFNKEGCSLAEVITEEGNIQCAYKLWKAQGWGIWVAFTNGSYLSSL